MGGRRWVLAAAVLLFLAGGVGLGEATGVTRVAATVIRILTPEGTLLVETDDPDVEVNVKQDGDRALSRDDALHGRYVVLRRGKRDYALLTLSD